MDEAVRDVRHLQVGQAGTVLLSLLMAACVSTPSTPLPTETDAAGISDGEASRDLDSVPATPQPSGRGDSTNAQDVRAQVLRVIDGDTLEVEVDGQEERVRLAQVAAPELNECFGEDAARRVSETVEPGDLITLRRDGPPFRDPYDRLLAEVLQADGTSLNQHIVASGWATWGSDFASEDPALAERLEAAEESARSLSAGLWSTCDGIHPRPTSSDVAGDVAIEDVRFDAPGDDMQFGDSEYVALRNATGSPLSVSNWILRDDDGNFITLPSGTSIPAGELLQVYSGDGPARSGAVNADRHQAMWNNSGDVVILEDGAGGLVARTSYS